MTTQPRVAVCGYGRFGASLCELAIESGFQVAAFDPIVPVPDNLRKDSLAELCAAAEDLIVSVPLENFDDVLGDLLPHLSTKHLVLDVGSVKLEPVRAMRHHLDGAVGWIGTHPLFGPTSLARGERPLRVVLCEGSSDSSQRGRELWTALGCECLEQTAELHDRAMAGSHALAFFLAKGLLDVRAGEGAAFTPPSFDAIGKTITAVRSDAGHLFRSIQNRNPFAHEERARLIEALERIHDELARPASSESRSPNAVQSIPALGDSLSTQEAAPALLAELDRELLELLARRSLLCARTSKKERRAHAETLASAAQALGLDAGRIAALLRLLEQD